MITELQERVIRVKAALAMRDADPLRFWHHSSESSRRATELLSEFDEVFVRAANKAGKTEWEYAAGLAMLQKRPALDGVRLPQWPGKIDGVSLELDYPTQKLSSQQTVLRLLGDWPHHPLRHGDVLAGLRIMPLGGNDDQSRWSTLTFMSQKNLKAGTGVRADLVLANEPPRQDIWEEIRKAAHAGRRIVRIIGATPIKRREWYWLRDQYGNPPRGSITKHRTWVEVRWSLFDNRALNPTEVDTLVADYQKNPALFDARVYGDYVDATGLCPFDEQTLVRMLEHCHEPEMMEWRISREARDGEQQPVEAVMVEVEIFAPPKLGASYYMPVDLSSGVDDDLHDPAGLHIVEMGSGNLVARFVRHLDSYRMGVLAAGLARQYNKAMIQPESNKWALGFLQALADCGYGNIGHEPRQLRPGEWSREPGFDTNELSRGAMISAIQTWIEAWRIGVPYASCPSRKVIECILDLTLDAKGRPVAGPGSHDEDAIPLWGQALRHAIGNSGRKAPLLQQAPQTADQILIEAIRGRPSRLTPRSGSLMVPRPRPTI